MTTTLLPPLAPPPRPEGVDAITEPVVPADVAVHRSRLRRRMFWWSLGPVILVGLVAIKLLSLPLLAGLAQGSFEHRHFDRTVTASDGLSPVNVLEPWVQHFDRGTGLAGVGVLVDSRGEFEAALRLVPADQVANVCKVRTDLALVVEQQGDSSRLDGDATAAAKFYAEALSLIDASPDGCFDDPDSSATPPTKKPLDEEKARLEQKQQGSGGSGGDQGQGGQDQGQGGQGSQGQGSGGDGSDGQGGQNGQGQGDKGNGSGGSGGNDGSSGSSGGTSDDPLDKLQQQNGDAESQQQQENDRNRQFKKNDGDYSGKPW